MMTEYMNFLRQAADKLSVPEKVIYLFEMDLEKEYYVDNDGKIKKLDETV